MKREQLYYLRSRILDRMAYVRLYGPDFPNGHQTTLERERDQIVSQMSEHRATLRTEEQLTWHCMAEQEFSAAIFAFSSGDRHSGCRKFQQAEEYFRRSFKPRKIHPHFLVGPDGQITKT